MYIDLRHSITALSLLALTAALCSCQDDVMPPSEGRDLSSIPYNPEDYVLEIPEVYANQLIVMPPNNPMTVEGVLLGRKLFYDPILSIDSTRSCSSCHQIDQGFGDPDPISDGVMGRLGTRHSMHLLNVAFFKNELFWDGRVGNLEEQAREPIITVAEFDHSFPGVVDRIRAHPDYPEDIRRAFGITNTSEITISHVTRPIAQFERTIISGGEAKFDRFLRGEYRFTDEEQNGFDIFFDANEDIKDGECAHCHPSPLFTTQTFINNGLDTVMSLDDFPDLGRGAVTGIRADNGRFRVPSLRNVMLTAPYMHDGRFATIDEVLDHYSAGGFPALNIDRNMRRLNLTPDERSDLIAFLNTLTDTRYQEDPELQNPFR